jgi:S-DNA-T family DNA segregation ATPase FtsK/SpoIIIE
VPLLATVAPLVVSLVLFAVTRSAFTLVFAALGPVVAIASTVDARLQSRRTRRRETARFESDAARVAEAIDAAHRDERRAATGSVSIHELLLEPAIIVSRWRRVVAPELDLRLGIGESLSALRYDSAGSITSGSDPGVDETLAELRRHAAVLRDAPVVAAISSGVGIAGPRRLATAVMRALAVQLAATLSPQEWRVEIPKAEEDWLSILPHAVLASGHPGEVRFVGDGHGIRIVVADTAAEIPRAVNEVIDLFADGSASAGGAVFRPDYLALEEARLAASALAEIAEIADLCAITGAAMPDSVELSDFDIDVDGSSGGNLPATVGVGDSGPVVLDLVSEGPHAIVAGTTGSGKSELLLSWVLGMAAARSPADVTFLFVDFKGGASFGALLELPHSVGVITDLDAEQAMRALASLAAELRYRERALASGGLRAIDGATERPFPRLVVVVDEYAVLVETFPTLHSVFADIAARGRSLGVHLILCTQRPAGAVRDGILANCALRVSLRVTTAADSIAVLGADAAASLPARPLGRALVSVAGAAPTAFQVALSADGDVDRVVERWRGSTRPRAPWLPPLPARVPIETLTGEASPGDRDGIVFALADLPAEQAQRPVSYRPRAHGSLLVVGAAGSGKTGVLTAMDASPSGCDTARVPNDLPSLWDFVTSALSGTRTGDGGRSRVILLDDLDSAIASCQEAYTAALVELLGRLLRDGPALGIWTVLTTQRLGGALQGLGSLCGSSLLLRMPNRTEHALAGGEASDFVADLPVGAGHWRGSRVQVAHAEPLAPGPPVLQTMAIGVGTTQLAVVSTRPEQFAEALRGHAPNRRIAILASPGFGARPDALEVSGGGTPTILVGDPDVWQAQWSLLATLQRGGEILFDGCSLADLRALIRSRDLPPPFPPGTRPLWLRTPDGELARATLTSD